MCGIFGIVADTGNNFSPEFLRLCLKNIALISESRGKDSSGVIIRNDIDMRYDLIKGPLPVSELIGGKDYTEVLEKALKSYRSEAEKGNQNSFVAMGHARLVTNGSQLREENNQPVVKDDLMAIHNGIIVNVGELWNEHRGIKRKYDIDTEVLLSMTRKFMNEGQDEESALTLAMEEVFGTVSTAMLFSDRSKMLLATNNGSLYYLTNWKSFLVFASEGYFLKKFAEETKMSRYLEEFSISQLPPSKGLAIDFCPAGFRLFEFRKQEKPLVKSPPTDHYPVREILLDPGRPQREVILDMDRIHLHPKADQERGMLQYNWEEISKLRRCTRCLLPETFPFIAYDNKGVCNYCNNYKSKYQPKSLEVLKQLVEPYRGRDGQPDCIVPYSGGRDSTYTLHVVRNLLGLNPIAFTYDWGMVTDLARRNIARVCGKLQVENIIVSANIHWKRDNIRKNISAWLKNPELGMIPLFMAGDKYFFYYTAKIKKQTGIKLNIWGINNLENTEFKVGFCGIKPDFEKKRIYSLSKMNQLRLLGFVGKNFLQDTSYLNQSLLDTFGSFLSRYVDKKEDYYHLFDYYRWDEKEIENLLLHEYKWEKAIDTTTTWRIGDGTAGFYNYLYFTIAGFSEYDTFRSNQIREGMITREEGLQLIEKENIPRYQSIKWYLEIVGLNFEEVIRRINEVPKLYPYKQK